MNFRTDLAIERREVSPHKDDGMIVNEYQKGNIKITEIKVINEKGEREIGKPRGTYITIETQRIDTASFVDSELAEITAEEIKKLIPDGSALICGIGNEEITPDALGPKSANLIFATRHIGEELARSIGFTNLRSVSAVSPGVLGQTGMELLEVISGITAKVKPDFIIAVDALASRRLARLGATIQICDTGITPGGGVSNARSELSAKTLKIPVISIGVPTVVDAITLVNDITDGTGKCREASSMIVTPKEIDLLTDRASRLIAHSINCALQPDITPDDLLMLTS